jgi:hypothetical protein
MDADFTIPTILSAIGIAFFLYGLSNSAAFVAATITQIKLNQNI